MKEHFPGLKLNKFPRRVLKLDFEKDILPAEKKLIEEYGFLKEEVNFIMKYKPTVILLDHLKDEGMNTLYKVFVQDKGFDLDVVRTLVIKYPYILGKTQ